MPFETFSINNPATRAENAANSPPDESASNRTICISNRFRGPRRSSNGGYVSGLLAQLIDGPAEVTLFAPPPLEKRLSVETKDGTFKLLDDGRALAVAHAALFEVDVPAPVDIETALNSAEKFAGHVYHRHPECFVCGTERSSQDGLRIFTGMTPDERFVASAWLPSSRDSGADGRVRTEIIWAALDCPGYFALGDSTLNALLGRMSATINSRPRPNEPCVIMGWKIGRENRKHYAGSALFSLSGDTLAVARTTWIELKSTPN